MKKVSIGGQALIEGIMMKSPEKTAMAVRTPDKNIDIEYIEEKHIKDKIPFFGLPVIRGVVNFIESMILGYKTLMMSADKSGMTDLEEAEDLKKKRIKAEKKRDKLIAKGKLPPSAAETPIELPKKNSKVDDVLITVIMAIGVVLGVALAVLLFMWLPTMVFNGVNFLTGNNLPNSLRPLVEGILKIGIFVGYVTLVSLTKDIKRVFMYHGAEHKTIFCLENEQELTVENVKKQSRFHPRCGTSFMILMLVVGILINLLIVTIFPSITKFAVVWVLIKILMVPFICGVGYELIKICGKYDNKVTRIISAPGMWVQRITTKEPDDDMIEVAIASIEAVLPEDPKNLESDGCCPDF
ncbi:MAG: DUF1385 domain-containing protein [Acutalibacteraceae bacterium]|nr:DUF1385 domain-containing protein [Acutalibacteraceae bacterium]